MSNNNQPIKLNWEKSDIERKFGIKAGIYTEVNTIFAFVIGLILAAAFYATLYLFRGAYFSKMFFERGIIPYPIVLMTGWSFAIIFIKWQKIRFQEKSLKIQVVPQEHNFVLSPLTAEQVMNNIFESVDNPKHFILFSRIERTLANLRNIGQISDVDDVLKSQAENDENFSESTYNIVRGFTWAVPVLGFIGTVLGLSQAIGGFGNVLSSGTELTQLKSALSNVTSGLSVAFETTLMGLVGAMFIQLTLNAVKKREENFLYECDDYCHRYIVSKLRILPLETDNEKEPTV